jgi:hypothetical protein
MKTKDNTTAQGKFRFKVFDSITGELKRETPWIKNKIVSSSNHGLNLFCQHLIGFTVYPLEITQAKIGTGSTAPALGDTDLETPVLSGILRSNQLVTNNVTSLEFFISDSDLANGTYTEFGIFAGSQLFARAIISPSFTKASNENVSCEYELTFTSL